MLMIDLKVIQVDSHPVCPTTFTFNRKTYRSLRIPHNPLYDVVKSIELTSSEPFFQQTVEVLNGQKHEVSILAAQDVIQTAKCYFQTRLKIDIQSFGLVLLGMIAEGESLDFLDALSSQTLSKGVISALAREVHNEKVRKRIGEYLADCNRSDQDKRTIRSIVGMKYSGGVKEHHKESDSGSKNQNGLSSSKKQPTKPTLPPKQSVNEFKDYKQTAKQPKLPSAPKLQQLPVSNKAKKPSPPTKPSFKTKEQVLKEETPREETKPEQDNRRDGLTRSEKKKWDQMVYLGINGDNNEGWRQRYRPAKFQPRKPQQAQQAQQAPTQSIESKDYQIQTLSPKMFARPQCNLPIVFEYSTKGQTFDFSTLKFPVLFNIQPENINIFLEPNSITVLKGDKGFKRQTNYTFVENGLYAEGLTLLLNGVSNIQDGGQVINGATLEDIAPNCGWIIIQNMIVYQK